ncbi:MAG: hypothetical protein ACLGI6_01450 [Gammaproteobacteria bacterium]
MNDGQPLLFHKTRDRDAVLVTIVATLKPPALRAKVLKIYSARRGVTSDMLGREIEFDHGPNSWGNVEMRLGETGIVFLSSWSGRLTEDPWRGHMVVEDIDGAPHAIFPHMAPVAHTNGLYHLSRPDPKRSYARAVPLDATEKYMRELIAEIDRSSD